MSLPYPELARRSPTVAFLGGNLSGPHQVELAKQLGARLIQAGQLRVSVNGYKGEMSNDKRLVQRPSFGFAVASGAAALLTEQERAVRIITNLTDSRRGSSDTFEIGSMVEPTGSNDQSRMLSTVARSDMVCLGGGGTGTSNYFHLGLALDKPTLPLPFFGGAARKLCNRHRADLYETLHLEVPTLDRWADCNPENLEQAGLVDLARDIAQVLSDSVRTRCLVCMPFRSHFEWVYDQLIAPAATAASADLVRIDLENSIGDVSARFAAEIAQADSVIAIVTGQRPNVLYEVGFAHGQGKNVLFLCQRDDEVNEAAVPFYLRNHRTIWYPDRWNDEGVRSATEELLSTLRQPGAGRPA